MVKTLLGHMGQLANASTRQATSQNIATMLGAQTLLIFVRDEELKLLLPAQGYVQTIPGLHSWQPFFDLCVKNKKHEGTLNFPDDTTQKTAFGIAYKDKIVFLLLGGTPDKQKVADIQALLPLLAALFTNENNESKHKTQLKIAEMSLVTNKEIMTKLYAARHELQNSLTLLQQETEAKLATQQVLAESKRKFDALFDSTVVAIAQVNIAGNILEANKTFLRLFNYSKADLKQGMTTKELSAPGHASFTENIQHLLELHGEAEPVEKRYVRKDGTEFLGLVGAAMLPGSQDQYMAFILDISEAEKLKEINQAKDEFIALASHQLRTPATSVKQYLGIIIDGLVGDISEDQLQYLNIANNANNRQLNIINDLLKTAHIDTKGYKLTLQPHDIVKIVQDVISEYEPVLDAKDQLFEFSKSDASIEVNVDETEIAICIANLIENASKYSANKKIIRISVMRTENDVDICISDQGVGIAKADQQRIFEKFTRVDNVLSDTVSGNGLGLYWVKRIVKLHKGKMIIKSKVGKGSSFIVRLPL